MGIFRKQTARAPLTTVLLVLLLALSIAASSIGFTAWTSVSKQAETLDQQYTTIAIPIEQDAFRYGVFTTHEDGRIEYSDGYCYYPPNVVEEKAAVLPQVIDVDRRCLLGAHVKGVPSLTSGKLDILQYNEAIDQYCYNLSVLAVECTACDVTYEPSVQGESAGTIGNYYYDAKFKIIDVVSQNEAYEPRIGDPIVYACKMMNPDGSVPFEAGKNYLIRGFYQDYPIIQVIDEDKTEEMGTWQFYMTQYDPDLNMTPQNILFMNAVTRPGIVTIYVRPGEDKESSLKDFGVNYIFRSEDMVRYGIPLEGSLPFFAEYGGDWRDFLNTSEGQVWRDEIIPMCEINHESATVMLTDRLDSMYLFNVGDASILEGESITQSQYDSGANVCLVSASYAKANGLNVGDSLTLDFYNSGYAIEEGTAFQGVFSVKSGLTVCRHPLTPDTRIGFEQAYTIVGIYTAPEFTFGVHNFHADTIFIPKASVPNAERYEDPTTPMLNSIILKNGTAAEFESAINAQGHGNYYLYFDQGYSEAAETIQTLVDNAMRLMLVGIAMFVLASLLFLLLFARRTSSVMRSMRLLGVPKKQTWLECLGTLFTQEIIAVLLGNALAVVLYEKITVQLLSSTPALSIESVLLCGGVQLGALLLVGGIWMHMIAGRNLMQRSEGGILWKRNKAALSGA